MGKPRKVEEWRGDAFRVAVYARGEEEEMREAKSTIFVVESKNPDTGEWEVVDGAVAQSKQEYAEEEMQQDQADNPGARFRVRSYVPQHE